MKILYIIINLFLSLLIVNLINYIDGGDKIDYLSCLGTVILAQIIANSYKENK
jgi:hypothetical protein